MSNTLLKRLVKRVKQPLEVPVALNECWSMDFMSDVLTDGRKLRVFNVIDDCNREALAIQAGLSYPARAVQIYSTRKTNAKWIYRTL